MREKAFLAKQGGKFPIFCMKDCIKFVLLFSPAVMHSILICNCQVKEPKNVFLIRYTQTCARSHTYTLKEVNRGDCIANDESTLICKWFSWTFHWMSKNHKIKFRYSIEFKFDDGLNCQNTQTLRSKTGQLYWKPGNVEHHTIHQIQSNS